MVMDKYSYLNKLYLISVGQINVFIRKALYTVAYVFIRTISTLQEALSSSAFSALHKTIRIIISTQIHDTVYSCY